MGYLHIENLYRGQDVLLFKEVYAMEKIHGTSAHISWKAGPLPGDPYKMSFFSGGEPHANFIKLFDEAALRPNFEKVGQDVIIFGEAYGGKCQGMSATYGKALKFIVFDVKIGDYWLDVDAMDRFATGMGLEVVAYKRIPATQEAVDAERDADSTQAIRNGCGPGKKREGIVIRPLIELRKNNSDRVISKHKRDDFSERKTLAKDIDPNKLVVLQQAQAIADEWVTPNRLEHVLDKLPVLTGSGTHEMSSMGAVIKAMVEDVYREAKGEIVESKDAERAIGARAAQLFKFRLQKGPPALSGQDSASGRDADQPAPLDAPART